MDRNTEPNWHDEWTVINSLNFHETDYMYGGVNRQMIEVRPVSRECQLYYSIIVGMYSR